MMTILSQIIEAETTREVDAIVTKNIYNIDAKSRNFICSFSNKRKRNILRLEREKKASWSDLIN